MMRPKFSYMILSLLILYCFVFPVSASSVESESLLNSVEFYTQEEMEQARAEEEAYYVEELVRNVEKHLAQYRSNFNKKDASVQWTYPQRRILYVPHHVQQTDYWCGPTSVSQIIDYNGEIGSVAGSTEYQKQNTLAIQSGTTNKRANTLSLRNVLRSECQRIFDPPDHEFLIHRDNQKVIHLVTG